MAGNLDTLASGRGTYDLSSTHDDGRGSLAVVAGLIAALVGGAIWAAIFIFAHLEIGWAAWGVGVLVGIAMAGVTTNRGKGMQLTAAALAAIGLISGKAFIHLGGEGAVAKEIWETPEYLEGAIAWQMYDSREFKPAMLERLDTWRASGDTLSDALWLEMRKEAATKIAGMTPEQKEIAARTQVRATLDSMGLVGGIRSQLGLWDLLWFGLALATAHRMLGAPGQATQRPAEGNA
jgi:hypothetical protein